MHHQMTRAKSLLTEQGQLPQQTQPRLEPLPQPLDGLLHVGGADRGLGAHGHAAEPARGVRVGDVQEL